MNRADPYPRPFFRLPAVAFPHRWREIVDAVAEAVKGDPGARQTAGLLFADAKGALRFVLECMRVRCPQRDEVIIPAYTCYSVPAAVIAAQLRVVLCDVSPETLDFRYAQLAGLAGPRTLAIVAGHLFRSPVDYPALRATAASAGAFLIDDAAQGGDVGTLRECGADARIRSFGRGKPVSAGGGGLLSIADGPLREDTARACARLPDAPLLQSVTEAVSVIAAAVMTHPRLYWLPARLPFLHLGETRYPDAVTTAPGSRFVRALLPRAESAGRVLDSVRREHCRHYRLALSCARGLQPAQHRNPDYAPHRFPIYVRPQVQASCLRSLGRLGVSRMYPGSLNQLRCLEARAVRFKEPMPGAEWLAAHLLTLPTHHRVTADSREIIIRTLRRASP
ncbi:MAG: DegT/DnrJ/EryC1/StrS family aminotransferase [Aquisalimonadaceae bacterium]